MNYNNYLTVFKWIYSRLKHAKKKQFKILFACMLLVAFFETITLGSIAFFASAVTDPQSVITSDYVAFVKQFIDAFFFYSAKGLIIGSGFIMCILITIKNCLKAFTSYSITKFSGEAEAYFGNILLEGFFKMPYQWHLDQNSADLINAIQWRTYVGRSFFQPCLCIFSDTLMISIMLLSLLIVQPAVSFTVLVVLSTSAFCVYKTVKSRIDKTSTIARNYQLSINREVTMSLQGIKDVKICRTESAFVSKYLNKANPLSKILGLQRFYAEAPVLILETIGFLMLFLSICIMLLKFKITTAYLTGTMALLAVTAWKTLPAVSQILNALTTIRNSLPFIKSQIKYISLVETNIDNNHSKNTEIQAFSSCIEFEEVTFAYQNSKENIIKDLTFNINKGDTIGIIGASGAGKSTLIDLLIGLLTPVSGTIKIDGQTLTNVITPWWLSQIGYVPQSPYIYDGSLAENIAFGVMPGKEDRPLIKKCCSMAFMDNFVQYMPDGIDTFIGERGVKLSGGQQQRLAIARALYRRPKILIFDEATSSLDTKSENAVKNTIYSFKGKHTLIIIAHRLTTVAQCDWLIWLEQGRIKMSGATGEILRKYHQFQDL